MKTNQSTKKTVITPLKQDIPSGDF